MIADVLGAFPGVRFLGTTLWTDYLLYGADRQQEAMDRCRRGMNCHSRIEHHGRSFMPEDALALHDVSRAWLAEQLAQPFDGKTVVITHHGVSWNSVAEDYRSDILSAGFSSDMEHLVAKADLWIHGHTHDSYDYKIEKCRVVVNPRGYPLRYGGGYENKSFNSQLIVEV